MENGSPERPKTKRPELEISEEQKSEAVPELGENRTQIHKGEKD